MIPISIQDPNQWSIGIYKMTRDSSNRLSLREISGVTNPVLSRKTIPNRGIQFVADPFLIKENATFYLFFEIMHYHKGTIGLAESRDGSHWSFTGTVLEEPFHLSYPCIVKDNHTFYMFPECAKTSSIRLYRASQFPAHWVFVKELATGRAFVDPTVFWDKGKWWLLASDTSNSHLYIYFSDTIEGDWTSHRNNPIIQNDTSRARPGGNRLHLPDKQILIFQDCSVDYGKALRLFELLGLAENDFQCEEVDNSFIQPPEAAPWNKDGIHHISHQELGENSWLIALDGKSKRKLNHAYIGNLPVPITSSIVKLFCWSHHTFLKNRR